MEDVKAKIKTIVNDYVAVCSNEFELFKMAHREKVEAQRDDFASTQGMDVVERMLFEVPETLHAMLKARLSDDDWVWFTSKEGARWFAKSFVQFRAGKKV